MRLHVAAEQEERRLHAFVPQRVEHPAGRSRDRARRRRSAPPPWERAAASAESACARPRGFVAASTASTRAVPSASWLPGQDRQRRRARPCSARASAATKCLDHHRVAPVPTRAMTASFASSPMAKRRRFDCQCGEPQRTSRRCFPIAHSRWHGSGMVDQTDMTMRATPDAVARRRRRAAGGLCRARGAGDRARRRHGVAARARRRSARGRRRRPDRGARRRTCGRGWSS